MNIHFKNIAIIIVTLLLLNGCSKPGLKFELVKEKRDDRGGKDVERYYVVSGYKNDDNSDKELKEFAYKIADSIGIKSHEGIMLVFYKPNEKTDLNAVKEGRSDFIPKDGLAKYSWSNGKLIFSYIRRREEKEAQVTESPVHLAPGQLPPPIVTADTGRVYHSTDVKKH